MDSTGEPSDTEHQPVISTRWDQLARRTLQALFETLPQPLRDKGISDSLLEALRLTEPAFSDDDLATFRRCERSDSVALARLLDDPRARHVVRFLMFATRTVPEPLFEPMLRAGIHTIDPSYNKNFIEPCVLCYGRRRTMACLIDLTKRGSDFEKAGGVNALYWGSMSREEVLWSHRGESWTPVPGPDEPVDDLRRELESWAVGEFVRNPNVDVRRSLVRYVSRDVAASPDELRQAIEIGKAHSDPYIQHRLSVQLGLSGVYPNLPDRVTRR